MAMTKRDFAAIAAIVYKADQDSISEGVNYGAEVEFHAYREMIRNGLADYFATQNPRFDREKFIDACFGE